MLIIPCNGLESVLGYNPPIIANDGVISEYETLTNGNNSE